MPVCPSVSFFIAVETDSIRRGEMKTESEKNGNEKDDRNGA